MCAEENYKIIKEACKGTTCEEGGMSAGKLWQLKKKLRGIIAEPPSAMLDGHGNLITSSHAIEELTVKMYEDRLKSLKIREELRMHKLQRENVCDERLKKAQENITQDWTLADLELVLIQLKNNKSRDPLGWANELFKPNCAGQDLKVAVLSMMNLIKRQQTVPETIKQCNITSIYKKKGSRKDFANYRGIKIPLELKSRS